MRGDNNVGSMEEFTYHGAALAGIVLRQAFGAFGIVLATAVAVWALAMTVRVDQPLWCPGALAAYMAAVGWWVGLGLINAAPTVWVGERGLAVSTFPFGRVLVSWANVVDVGAGHVPFGGTLVRTRRLTRFHRCYGWMYSHSLYPSFLIRRDIEDHDRLLRLIDRGAARARDWREVR